MSIIVLHPCSSFDVLATELSEDEAAQILAAWTAAHHPSVLQEQTELPRWESALYPAYDLQAGSTVFVPLCCEPHWNEDWERQTAECQVVKLNAESSVVPPLFSAVAVARLLSDLLSRHMYYVNTNDDTRLRDAVYEAVRGGHIKEVFEEIAQMRDNYYPITNYFVELTLVTESTLDKLLYTDDKTVRSLFAPTSLIASLPEKYPETFAALKDAVDKGNVRFIADMAENRSLNTSPILDIADALLETISTYRELFAITPKIFGSQHIQLSPVLPQLLHLTGFKGVLHFAPLDGWYAGGYDQSKMIWQGVDGTDIDALIREPVDATKALSFFQFAQKLGETLNMDNAPTTLFAMFAGQTSPFLEELKIMTQYTESLGKFLDIESYFESTSRCGNVQQLGFEKYPQKQGTNSIPNLIDAHQRRLESAKTTAETLLGKLPGGDIFNWESFPVHVYDAAGNGFDVPPIGFVKCTPQERDVQVSRKTQRSGMFHKIFPKEQLLITQAVDTIGKGIKRHVYLLNSVYFQAKIDAASGMLRSIFVPQSRFNHLSRQLAVLDGHEYSIAAADTIEITENTPLAGELKITGRLVMPDGTLAADYTETIRVRKHSRLLEFKSDFHSALHTQLIRYAWNDNTLDFTGWVNDGCHPLAGRNFISPYFVDLRNVDQSLTFFSDAVQHRRIGERKLDTVITDEHCLSAVGIGVKHPVFQFSVPRDNVKFETKNVNVQRHWLFQLESETAVALHWEPSAQSGFTVYLLETQGKRQHFAFRMFKNPVEAAALNFLGEIRKTLKIQDDAVLLDIRPHELLIVKVLF